MNALGHRYVCGRWGIYKPAKAGRIPIFDDSSNLLRRWRMATWDLFFAVKWRQWQPPFLNKLHLHLCSWSFRASGRCLRCRMGSWGLVEMDLHHWRAPLHVLLNSKMAPWVLVWGLGPEAKPTARYSKSQGTVPASVRLSQNGNSFHRRRYHSICGNFQDTRRSNVSMRQMFFVHCVLFVSYCTAIIDSYC